MSLCVLIACSQDIAKSMGYATYAEMSLSTKMAGSVPNVLNMIDRYFNGYLFVVALLAIAADSLC